MISDQTRARSDMKTLSIITPVYFNEESLPHLFTELEKLEELLAERSVG